MSIQQPQQRQVAIQAQGEINVEKIIKEMKGSALARSNWEQLISSAPIALKCLGACFMAANSKGTKKVEVPKLPEATLDRPLDLPGNLARCSNIGTNAFILADKNMGEIYDNSRRSEDKVYDIIELLGDRNAAQKQLPSSLRMLQDNADSCYEAAKRIDAAFTEWLVFVQELYEACQSRSSSVAREAADALTAKAIAAQKVKSTETQIASTKKTMEELGKTLTVTRTAFTKAAESQPSGWELMGQELVKSLGDCLMAGMTHAMNGKGGSITSKPQSDTKGNSGAQNSRSSGSSQASETPDPAYSYVRKDLYLYDLLQPVVKDANGDVNWELASGSGGKGAQSGNSGLAFIEGMLKESKVNFDKQTGGGLATSTYKRVLDDAIKVAGEMSQVLKDSTTNLNASRPKKDVRALQLQSQNSSFSPASSTGALPDPNLKAPETDAKSSHTQAMLSTASANLKTTASTLAATNKVFGETAKMLAEQESNLMEVNATLARLTADVISLEESKEILLQCIALIIQLKARIVDLVDFFGMLSTVIKTITEKLVAQWIETIKIAVTGNANAGAAGVMFKVGQYSLESAERTMILHGSVCIAAYYSFFTDVAKSWRDVSEKSIMPGIELAESLSTEGDAKAKMARLEKWSREASENIKTICKKQRQEIQDGMEERVTSVQNTIKSFPPPPAAIVEVTEKVLPELVKGDVKALQAEQNNNAITIVTGRRRDP